jgi:hypothetical protein
MYSTTDGYPESATINSDGSGTISLKMAIGDTEYIRVYAKNTLNNSTQFGETVTIEVTIPNNSPPGVPDFTITPSGAGIIVTIVGGTYGSSPITSYQYAVGSSTEPSTYNNTSYTPNTIPFSFPLTNTSGHVWIKARNINGFGIAANKEIIIPAPAAITNLAIIPGDSQATASWTASPFATGYKYTIDSWTTTQTTVLSSVVIPNLINGLNYTFEIKSTNVTGDSPSISNSFTLSCSIPVTPQPPTVAVNSTSAIVSWTAPPQASGCSIVGYTVITCDSNGTAIPSIPQANAIAKSPNPPPTTLTITALTPGSSYTFKVSSSIGTGSSSKSSALSGSSIPVTISYATAVPCVLVAGTIGESTATITISYTAPAGSAPVSGYQYSYSTSSTPSSWTNTSTTISLSGLKAATPYNVWARAYTGSSQSITPINETQSKPLSFTTLCPLPPVPYDVIAVLESDNTVTVVWSSKSSTCAITGYTVIACDINGNTLPSQPTITLSDKYATVSNLAPGEYTFKVSAKVSSLSSELSSKSNLINLKRPPWASVIIAGVAWEGCKPGFKDTGIRCENIVGGGVGQLKVCPPGWTNDGLTCREPISMSSCPAGWVDDGLICRNPIRCDPVSWDGCCNRGLFGECYGCARGGGCRGGETSTKTLSGGNVKGRGAGSDLPCPPGTADTIGDGLCYSDCDPVGTGRRREGLFCTASYTKRSEILANFGNDPKYNIFKKK